MEEIVERPDSGLPESLTQIFSATRYLVQFNGTNIAPTNSNRQYQIIRTNVTATNPPIKSSIVKNENDQELRFDLKNYDISEIIPIGQYSILKDIDFYTKDNYYTMYINDKHENYTKSLDPADFSDVFAFIKKITKT